MRAFAWMALGILIGATALGAVWAATSDSSDSEAEVRISAERLDDGRIEVGLQQRGDDGDWGDTRFPPRRFLETETPVGETRYSTGIGLPLVSRADRATAEYRDYLVEASLEVGHIYNAFFADEENPDAVPGTLLCVIDARDANIDALCDGAEQTYNGEVERLTIDDWDAGRDALTERMTDESVVALVTSSVPTTILASQVKDSAEVQLPLIYWIELLDQHLATPDQLFCQVSHSGEVIPEQADLFWGLASEVSDAAASQMGIQLEFSSHSDASSQADAIRACIDNDASVIATTLVEPDALSTAVDEANAAGIPVVSFNSGARDAADTGTALHIALDDYEAGRLAGEEFNSRGVDGAALCVIHEPNNVGLHDRCDGFEEVYSGSVERWTADDPTAVIPELIARFSEGDVSSVLTLSVVSAWQARVANARAESELSIAAFGFSVGLAEDVIDGSVMFTIFDHPEIQTYLSAAAAVMADRWRLDPVEYFNGMTLLIHPQIADAEYMQRLVDSMFDD